MIRFCFFLGFFICLYTDVRQDSFGLRGLGFCDFIMFWVFFAFIRGFGSRFLVYSLRSFICLQVGWFNQGGIFCFEYSGRFYLLLWLDIDVVVVRVRVDVVVVGDEDVVGEGGDSFGRGEVKRVERGVGGLVRVGIVFYFFSFFSQCVVVVILF